MKVVALLQFTVFSAAAAAIVVFFSIWFESIIETFDDILVPCQYGTTYVNDQCSCFGTPFTGKYCGVCNCSNGYCVLGGTTRRISSDYGCECPRKTKYFGYLCDSCNTLNESTCEGECKENFFGDKCQQVCYPSFSYESTLLVASEDTCGVENKSGTGETFETTISIDQCTCGKRCLENTLCNSFTHITIRDIPYCYLKTGLDVEDANVGIYGRTKLDLQQGKCKSTRSAGGECNMCNGHGTCNNGRCECDKDWYDYKYEQCSVSCPKKSSVVRLAFMCKAAVEDAAECLDITTRLNQSAEYSLTSGFSSVHTQCYSPGCYITDGAAYFNDAVPETTVFFGAQYVTSLFGTSIAVPSLNQVILTGGKIKGLQIGTHNMNYGPLNYFERDIKYVVGRVENNVALSHKYIVSDGDKRMVLIELSTVADNNGGQELHVTVLNAMETDVSEYLTSVQLNNAWDNGSPISATADTFTLFALSGNVLDCASSTVAEYVCKELPCNGHGACTVSGNKPGCACEDGWVGEDCDIPCPGVLSGEGQCFGNGVCVIELDSDKNIATKCTCDDMYRGEDCSIKCPGQFNIPCSGHGICDENGLCTCRSSPQWTGTGCTCSDLISCNGRGSCVDGKCACDGKYAGSNCLDCKESFYGSSCQLECKASQAGRVGDVLGCHGRGECVVTGMGTRFETVECACESESFTLIENGRVDIFSSIYSSDIQCSDCFSTYFPKYEVFQTFGKKNFELIQNDGLRTYSDLQQLAEDNGGRLPTRQEILDYDTPVQGGSNLFTPISDSVNSWVSIGTVSYHDYGFVGDASLWGNIPSYTDTGACRGTAATQYSPEQWVLVDDSAGKTFTLNYVSVAASNQTDCQYKCYDTSTSYVYASFTTHDNSCRCSGNAPSSPTMDEIGTTYVGDGIYQLEKRRCWTTTTLIVIEKLEAPQGIYIPCQFECTEETCNDLGRCNINYGEFGESLCSCFSGPNNDKHVKDSSFCTECDDNWYPLAPDADDGCTNFCIADLALAPYNGDFPTVCDTGMIDCIECNGNGFCGPDGKCDCSDGFTGEECQIECTSSNGVVCGGHGFCKTNALQTLLEYELEEIANSGALYECECDPQDTISDEARDDFESNFELAEAPLKEYFGETCDFYCEKPPWVDAGECNGLGNCTVFPIETPELQTFKCNEDSDCNTVSIQQITSADNGWTQKKGPFCHKNIYPTILNTPASDRSSSTGNAAHSLLNYDGVGLTGLSMGQFLKINLQKEMAVAGFRIQSSGDFATLNSNSYVSHLTVDVSVDDITYSTHESSLGTGLTSTVHERNVYFSTPANAQYIKISLAGFSGSSVMRIGIIVSPSQCQDPLVNNTLCKDTLRYQRPLHARSKYCVENSQCKQKLDNYDWHSYCVNLNDAVTFKVGAETCGDMTHFCTTSPQSEKCYQYSLLGDTVTEIQQVNDGCYEADKIHYPFKMTEAYRIDLGEEYFDQLYLPFSRHAKKFGKFTERINVLDYCNQYSKKFGLPVTSVASNERYLCGEDVLSEKLHCLYGLQEYEWKPFAVRCPTTVTKYATLKEAILNRNDGCVIDEVEPRTQLLNTPVAFGGFCYFNEDCQSGKCHENTCCSSTVDVTNCKLCNGNGECDSCVNGTTFNGTHCQHDTSCKMESGVKVCAYSYHFNFNGYCNYNFLVYPDGSSNPGTNALEKTAECAKQCSRAITTIYQNTSTYACSPREYWNIYDTSQTKFYNRDADRRLDDGGSAYTCRTAGGGNFGTNAVSYSYVERRDDFISNAFLIAPNGGLCRCIEDKQIYGQNCGVSCDSGCESYYRTFTIDFKEFKDGVGFIDVPKGNECEIKEQCSSGECLEKCCIQHVPNCIKCDENGACIEYLNAGVHECTYPLIWEDDVGCVNTSSTTLVEALDLVDATCDSINGVFPQCTLPETPCTFNPCNTGDECIVDGADALCIATGILNCTCKFNLECLGVTFSTYKCLVPDVKVPYVEEDGCTLDIYEQERSHSILNISQFDLLYPKKRIHDFADGYVAYNVSSVSECPYMCRNSQYMSFSTQRMQCQCADSISPITAESLWVERKVLPKIDSTREFCLIEKNNVQPESPTGMDYTHCHKQCLAQQDDFAVEMKEFAVWAGSNTDCSCLPYSFEDCYKFGIATNTHGDTNAAYIVGDIYEGIYEKKTKTCSTNEYAPLVPFTTQSSGTCNVQLSKEECEAYSDYIFQDVTKSSLTWEVKDIHISPYNYIGATATDFIFTECVKPCSSSHAAMSHDTCRAFCSSSNKLYFSIVEDNSYVGCRCSNALDDLEENQSNSDWGRRYTTGTYEIHRSPGKVHTWNIYELDTFYTDYDFMIKVRSCQGCSGEGQKVYSGTQELVTVSNAAGVLISKFRFVNDQWSYVTNLQKYTWDNVDNANALQAFVDGFRKGELLILTMSDEMTHSYGNTYRIQNLKEHFGAEYLPLSAYGQSYTLISIKDVGKIWEEWRADNSEIIKFIGLNFWEQSESAMASGCVQTMDYQGNKALVYNTEETEYECTGEAKCICKNEFYDPPLQFPYVLTSSLCVDSIGTKEEFVNARSWFNIHETYNFEYHERLFDTPVATRLKATHPLRITGGTAGDGLSWRGAHKLKVFQYDPTLWILCNSGIQYVRMVGVRVIVINGEYYIRYEEGKYFRSNYVDVDETNFYLYWQQGTVAVTPTAVDRGAYTLDHIWGELDFTFETICKNSKQSCVELSESFDWPKYCTEKAPLLASYRFDTPMLDDHNENINLFLYNEKQNVDFIRLWAKPTSMVLESGEFAVYSQGIVELVVTRLYFHKGQIFLNNLELLTSCPLTDKQCLEKMSYVPNEWIQLKLGFDYQNRLITFYYNNNVVVKEFHCMNENAPETTTDTLQCSGMGERITRIEAKDGTAKTYYDEIILEQNVTNPPLVSECGTYKYCNVNVNYREKCADVLMNVEYPLLVEPKQDIMKVCSEHREHETFSRDVSGTIENEIAMKRLDWNKYCFLHELIKENINEDNCGVQHLGWCGPDSHVLATSLYPQCVTECRHDQTCSAVRWRTDTNACNLLQSCLVSNSDVNWAHMFVKDHTYFEDFALCVSDLNEMEDESEECVREAFKTNWTSYCETINSLTVPEGIKSKCPERCYNGLRKDTDLCPIRLGLFSSKDTLITNSEACPSVDMAEYCYDVAQGKDEGVCSAVECKCDSEKSLGVSGASCELECPVGADGTPCGEGTGVGMCEYTDEQKDILASGRLEDGHLIAYEEPKMSLFGQCKCVSKEGSKNKNCDMECQQCNEHSYNTTLYSEAGVWTSELNTFIGSVSGAGAVQNDLDTITLDLRKDENIQSLTLQSSWLQRYEKREITSTHLEYSNILSLDHCLVTCGDSEFANYFDRGCRCANGTLSVDKTTTSDYVIYVQRNVQTYKVMVATEALYPHFDEYKCNRNGVCEYKPPYYLASECHVSNKITSRVECELIGDFVTWNSTQGCIVQEIKEETSGFYDNSITKEECSALTGFHSEADTNGRPKGCYKTTSNSNIYYNSNKDDFDKVCDTDAPCLKRKIYNEVCKDTIPLNAYGRYVKLEPLTCTANKNYESYDRGGDPSSDWMKMGPCESDCDNDNHCLSGSCFQRESSILPPGCPGANGITGSHDFCYIPHVPLQCHIRFGVDIVQGGKIGICEGSNGFCDCQPPFTNFKEEISFNWKGQEQKQLVKNYGIPSLGYEFVFEGECGGGTDIRVNNVPCTTNEAQCIEDCFQQCVEQNKLQNYYYHGFVIHRTLNTCWCETPSAYTCPRTSNAYTRFEFTGYQPTFAELSTIRMMQGRESFIKNFLTKAVVEPKAYDDTRWIRAKAYNELKYEIREPEDALCEHPIDSLEECKQALKDVGFINWDSAVTGSNTVLPYGCMFSTGGGVYFIDSTYVDSTYTDRKYICKGVEQDWVEVYNNFRDAPQDYACSETHEKCVANDFNRLSELEETSAFYNFDCNGVCPGTNNGTLIPCNNHGRCTVSGQCACEKAYITKYSNEKAISTEVGGQARSNIVESKFDTTGWRGEACEIKCPGYDENTKSMLNVCNGHGVCNNDGACECQMGYIGEECEFKCPGFDDGEDTVCSGHGRCELSVIDIKSTPTLRSTSHCSTYSDWGPCKDGFRSKTLLLDNTTIENNCVRQIYEKCSHSYDCIGEWTEWNVTQFVISRDFIVQDPGSKNNCPKSPQIFNGSFVEFKEQSTEAPVVPFKLKSTVPNTVAIELEFSVNNNQYMYNGQPEPVVRLCQNTFYTFKRMDAGHPLRVVAADACESCGLTNYGDVPSTSIFQYDVNDTHSESAIFTTIGEYWYLCTTHAEMIGKIIIEKCDNAFLEFSLNPTTGKFSYLNKDIPTINLCRQNQYSFKLLEASIPDMKISKCTAADCTSFITQDIYLPLPDEGIETSITVVNDSPYDAFDQDPSTVWKLYSLTDNGRNLWIQYTFEEPMLFKGYDIMTSDEFCPVSWGVKGSNDGGKSFTVFDTVIGQTCQDGVYQQYTISTPNRYKTIRWHFTEQNVLALDTYTFHSTHSEMPDLSITEAECMNIINFHPDHEYTPIVCTGDISSCSANSWPKGCWRENINNKWQISYNPYGDGNEQNRATNNPYNSCNSQWNCPVRVYKECTDCSGPRRVHIRDIQIKATVTASVDDTVNEESQGWIAGDTLKTSTYPTCLTECQWDKDCVAIRYVVSSAECNLLSSVSGSPNGDVNWKHIRTVLPQFTHSEKHELRFHESGTYYYYDPANVENRGLILVSECPESYRTYDFSNLDSSDVSYPCSNVGATGGCITCDYWTAYGLTSSPFSSSNCMKKQRINPVDSSGPYHCEGDGECTSGKCIGNRCCQSDYTETDNCMQCNSGFDVFYYELVDNIVSTKYHGLPFPKKYFSTALDACNSDYNCPGIENEKGTELWSIINYVDVSYNEASSQHQIFRKKMDSNQKCVQCIEGSVYNEQQKKCIPTLCDPGYEWVVNVGCTKIAGESDDVMKTAVENALKTASCGTGTDTYTDILTGECVDVSEKPMVEMQLYADKDSIYEMYETYHCRLLSTTSVECAMCECTSSPVDGRWSSFECDTCLLGYGQKQCRTACPTFDGVNMNKACSGEGVCVFGSIPLVEDLYDGYCDDWKWVEGGNYVQLDKAQCARRCAQEFEGYVGSTDSSGCFCSKERCTTILSPTLSKTYKVIEGERAFKDASCTCGNPPGKVIEAISGTTMTVFNSYYTEITTISETRAQTIECLSDALQEEIRYDFCYHYNEDDCGTCETGYSGKNCKYKCDKCLLGGTCTGTPSDLESSECSCPASHDVKLNLWSFNCCPVGFRVRDLDTFNGLTTDQMNAVAMTSVYNEEQTNDQRADRWCKACPGVTEDDWLDSNAFYNVCGGPFRGSCIWVDSDLKCDCLPMNSGTNDINQDFGGFSCRCNDQLEVMYKDTRSDYGCFGHGTCMTTDPMDFMIDGFETPCLPNYGYWIDRTSADYEAFALIQVPKGFEVDETKVKVYDTGISIRNVYHGISQCKVGTYQDVAGEEHCKDCKPGTFINEVGSLYCETCPGGKYQDEYGQSSCKDCPSGTFTNTNNECPPNLQYTVECEVLTRATEETACESCSLGKYMDVTGWYADKCKDCSTGKTTSVTGLTQCSNCPNGKATTFPGQVECSDCPIGKYSQNGEACKGCAAGSYSTVEGSTSCETCTKFHHSLLRLKTTPLCNMRHRYRISTSLSTLIFRNALDATTPEECAKLCHLHPGTGRHTACQYNEQYTEGPRCEAFGEIVYNPLVYDETFNGWTCSLFESTDENLKTDDSLVIHINTMWNKNTEFDTTNTWIIGDGYDGVNMPSVSDRSHLYDCMLRATDTVVRKYASWHSLANNAATDNCRVSDKKHGTDGGGWHAYSTGTGVWQRQGVIKAFSKGRKIIDYVEENDSFMYVFLQYRGERRMVAVDSGQPTLDLSQAECQTYGEAYYGWGGTYTGSLQPTGCHLLRTTYQYGGNTYPTNTEDLMKIWYNTASNTSPCSHTWQCIQYNEVLQDYKLDGEKQGGTWQINEKGSFTPSESHLLEKKLIAKAKEENLIAIFAVYAMDDEWKSWLESQTILSKHYNIPLIETDQQMLTAVVTTGEKKRDPLFYINPKAIPAAYIGYTGMFGHNFRLNGPIPTDDADDCYLKVSLTSSTQSLDACFNLFPECTQMCQQMHGFVQGCGGTCQPGYVSSAAGLVEFDKSLTVTQDAITDIHKNAYATFGYSAVCQKCPLGKYRHNGEFVLSSFGAVSLYFGTTLPVGYRYNEFDMTECQSCPSGTFPAYEQETCHQCPIGTFSDEHVKPDNYCTTCTVGKFTPFKGSLTCLTCGDNERVAFSLVQLEGDEDYVPPRHLTVGECFKLAKATGDPSGPESSGNCNDFYSHCHYYWNTIVIAKSNGWPDAATNYPPGCYLYNKNFYVNMELTSTATEHDGSAAYTPYTSISAEYDPEKLKSTSSLGKGTSFSISHNANWDKYINYYITDNLPMSKLWQNFTVPDQKNPIEYCAKVCHNGALGVPSSKNFIYFPEENKCKCALPILTPDLLYYEPTHPETVETCLGTPTDRRSCTVYGPTYEKDASFKYFQIHEQFNFESAIEICDKDDEDFLTDISTTNAYDGYIGVQNNVQLDISNAYGEAAEVCNKKCPQDNIKFYAYGECQDFVPTFQEVVLKNVHQTNYYSQKDVGLESCRDYCDDVSVNTQTDTTWTDEGTKMLTGLNMLDHHVVIAREPDCCTHPTQDTHCLNPNKWSYYEGNGCYAPNVGDAHRPWGNHTEDSRNIVYYQEPDGKSWANNEKCEDQCFYAGNTYAYAVVVKVVNKVQECTNVDTWFGTCSTWEDKYLLEWRCYCKYSDVQLTPTTSQYDASSTACRVQGQTGCTNTLVPVKLSKKFRGIPWVGGFQIHFAPAVSGDNTKMDMVCSCIDGQGLNDCRIETSHDLLSSGSLYKSEIYMLSPEGQDGYGFKIKIHNRMDLGAYLDSADNNTNFYGVKLATNSEVSGRSNIALGNALGEMTYQERVKECYARCQAWSGDGNMGMCLFFLVPAAKSSNAEGAMTCWAESFAEVGKYRTDNGDHNMYRNDHFDVYSRYDINIATYEHFGVGRTINTDHYNPIDTTKACWYAMNMHFNMYFKYSNAGMGFTGSYSSGKWTSLHSRVYQEAIFTDNPNLPLGCFLTTATPNIRSYVNDPSSPNALTYTVSSTRPDWIMSNSNIHPFECKCTTKRTHCVDSLQLTYYCSGVTAEGIVVELQTLDGVTEESATNTAKATYPEYIAHFCCLDGFDCSSSRNNLVRNYEEVFLTDEYLAQNHVVYVKAIALNYHASDHDVGNLLPEISCKIICNNEEDCDGIFYGGANLVLNTFAVDNIDLLRFPIDSCYFTKIFSRRNVESYNGDDSFFTVKYGENMQTLSNFRSEVTYDKCRALVLKHALLITQVQNVQVANSYPVQLNTLSAPFGCLYKIDTTDTPHRIDYAYNINSNSNALCGSGTGIVDANVLGYYCIVDAFQNAILGTTGVDFHPKSWFIFQATDSSSTCEQLGTGASTLSQSDCATIVNQPLCSTEEYNGAVPYGCSSLYNEETGNYCMLYSTSITDEGSALCLDGVIKADEFADEKRVTCYCQATEEFRSNALFQSKKPLQDISLYVKKDKIVNAHYDTPDSVAPTGNYHDILKFVKRKYSNSNFGVYSNKCSACPGGKNAMFPGSLFCLEDCEKGTFWNANTKACANCPLGKYQDFKGQYSCKGCQAGTFADTAGLGTCKDCPVGKFTSTTLQTSCTLCLAGQYQDQTKQTSCKNCIPGKFQTATGQNSCTNCGIGQYQGISGSSSCANCAPGRVQNSEGQSSCPVCSAGKYQDQNGQSSCKNCGGGTYSSAGASSCSSCPSGQYQNSEGQSSCKKCGGGTYQNQNGQSGCKDCPQGQYQNQNGQASCKGVSTGYYTMGAQQTSQHAGCRRSVGSGCWGSTCPCYSGASRGYGDCNAFKSRHSYSNEYCYSCWCFIGCSTCCDTTHYYWFYADC